MAALKFKLGFGLGDETISDGVPSRIGIDFDWFWLRFRKLLLRSVSGVKC